MKIDLKDLLTIEDKEYAVAAKMKYNGKDYIYLVNISENSDVKFCLIENKRIFEIFDKEIITELMKLITKNIKE